MLIPSLECHLVSLPDAPQTGDRVAQRSCVGEKAKETPRRLDSRRGQSGIERLVGYLMVDGEFVV